MIRKRVALFGSGLLLMAVGYWVPRLYTVAVTAVGSMSAAQWSLRCSAPNAKVTPAVALGCSEGRSILMLGWLGEGVGVVLCLYAAETVLRKPGPARQPS